MRVGRIILMRPTRDASGMYIGPRGGKWADPKHTIPWKPEGSRKSRTGTKSGGSSVSSSSGGGGYRVATGVRTFSAAGDPIRTSVHMNPGAEQIHTLPKNGRGWILPSGDVFILGSDSVLHEGAAGAIVDSGLISASQKRKLSRELEETGGVFKDAIPIWRVGDTENYVFSESPSFLDSGEKRKVRSIFTNASKKTGGHLSFYIRQHPDA